MFAICATCYATCLDCIIQNGACFEHTLNFQEQQGSLQLPASMAQPAVRTPNGNQLKCTTSERLLCLQPRHSFGSSVTQAWPWWFCQQLESITEMKDGAKNGGENIPKNCIAPERLLCLHPRRGLVGFASSQDPRRHLLHSHHPRESLLILASSEGSKSQSTAMHCT